MDKISIEVIFVIIIMLVSAIKWVAENVLAKKGGGPPPLDGEGGGSTLEELYEEARREIHERQGRMFPEAEEAETYRGDRQVEVRPVATVGPPPLPTTPPQSTSPPAFDRFRKPQQTKLSSAEKAALARVQERQRTEVHKKHHAPAQSELRKLLKSPSAARNAILLREILGPPKGARDIQDHLV